MGNAYDNASLIVTPNAYKASKIYALKPTDGSGDLSFSRAGSKMVRNSSGLWETIATNIPPLSYPVGGGCPSWLFEAEAENIIFNSLAVAANWTIGGGATITDESVSTPFDGATSAIKVSTIILANSGCYKGMSRASAVNANWVIVKKGTLDYCGLYDAAGGAVAAWFNIANGTIGTIASGYTATIADEGDGWYRCAISKTAGEAASIIEVMFTNTDNSSVGAIGDSYLCFAQNELGSTATSPIITAGSSVTRLADSVSKTGISALIGQTEGTILLDYVASAQVIVGGSIGVTMVVGDVTDSLQLYNVGTTLYWFARHGAGILIDQTADQTLVAGTRYKIAYAYKAGDYALYINGTQKRTSTAAAVPATSQFNLNASGYGASPATIENKFNDVIFYKTKLSNTELEELTTI